MKKPDLIDKCTYAMNSITRREVERSVEAILNLIGKELAEGGRAEFRGFGSFSATLRKPRLGRNPKSGDMCQVKAKYVPVFRPGIELKKRVNGSD